MIAPKVSPSRDARGRERPLGIARELLRIDRLDEALRAQWVASRFRDRTIARSLGELSAAAQAWLGDVIDDHGWPGHALVGRRAAAAALRLIQHADCVAFQRRCLKLVVGAAAIGDVPRHYVAYLTDAVRIAAGQRQLYGTKFRRRGGALVPLPIARATTVDRRRAEVGLPPIAVHARRITRQFAWRLG